MAWTYDPNLITPRDQVRFKIGETPIEKRSTMKLFRIVLFVLLLAPLALAQNPGTGPSDRIVRATGRVQVNADGSISIIPATGKTVSSAGFWLNEIATPGTPPVNTVRLYAKDKSGVSALYFKQDDGTEVELGASLITSVFGRTGAVVASSNDYTWAQINKTTSSLADITTRNYSDLQGTPSTFAPSAHASSHAAAGSDAVTIAQSQVTNLTTDLAGKQAALGFTAENSANKRTTFQVTPDDTHYASEKLVKDSLDGKQVSALLVMGHVDGGELDSPKVTFASPSFQAPLGTTNDASVKVAVPYAGTFKNLTVRLLVFDGDSTWTVTLYKNGSATSLSVICGTTTGGYSDIANSVTMSVGDTWSVKLDCSSAGFICPIVNGVSVEYTR